MTSSPYPPLEDNEAHFRFEGHVVVDGALRIIQGDGGNTVQAVLHAIAGVPRPGTHHG